MKNLPIILLYFVFGVSQITCAVDLELHINFPINSPLATAWLNILQEAYNAFLVVVNEMAKNTVAMILKTANDFEAATKACFSLVKGRAIHSMLEIRETAKALSNALARAVVIGIQAVGDLMAREEKVLSQKLSGVMEMLQVALEITYNLIPITENNVY